jgi:hypothetical protein
MQVLEDFLVREEDDAQQQDSSARSTRPLPVRQPEDTPEDLEELAKSFVMRDTMQRRHDRSSAISMRCTPDGLQAATEALSKDQAPKKDSRTMWMLRTRVCMLQFYVIVMLLTISQAWSGAKRRKNISRIFQTTGF